MIKRDQKKFIEDSEVLARDIKKHKVRDIDPLKVKEMWTDHFTL